MFKIVINVGVNNRSSRVNYSGLTVLWWTKSNADLEIIRKAS